MRREDQRNYGWYDESKEVCDVLVMVSIGADSLPNLPKMKFLKGSIPLTNCIIPLQSYLQVIDSKF